MGNTYKVLACGKGVIFLRFSGERKASAECESCMTGGAQKKITPVCQPLFMLFRPQTHSKTSNQLQHLIKVAQKGLSCDVNRATTSKDPKMLMVNAGKLPQKQFFFIVLFLT